MNIQAIYIRTNQARPRSIISNQMKSYFIGLSIQHTVQFSKRLLLKMYQQSVEGSVELFVWSRTLYEEQLQSRGCDARGLVSSPEESLEIFAFMKTEHLIYSSDMMNPANLRADLQ